MSVIITELLDRADTGVSVTPYICKTVDGREIFVKPEGVLQSSLVAEWIGGKLAEHMDLPCAEICIVEVPELLAKYNRRSDWSDFRAGIGFGSYALGRGFRDLQFSDLAKLPKLMLAKVYLFDYWIQNVDRMMGVFGGNPNTLVSYDVSEMYVIDHDSAFDEEFDLKDFKSYHLGRSEADVWRNKDLQDAWLKKAKRAMQNLEQAWEELPDSWVYSKLDNSDTPRYTLNPYRELLEKPFTDSDGFWKTLLT